MQRKTAGSVMWRCPPFFALLYVAALACEPARQRTTNGDSNSATAGDARMIDDSATNDVPQLPGVRVTVHAPDTARVGDTVHLDVVVENSGTDSVTLYLRGREPTADVQVEHDGARLWSSLDERMVPAVVMIRELAPRERFTMQVPWSTGAAARTVAGTYTVRALLLTDGIPLRSPPVSLRLVP